MAQSPLSRLNFSKQHLVQLQHDLLEKREEVIDVAERLRDASLTRLYGAGASTLSTAAELLDKVPFARDSAAPLREGARVAEQAGAAVNLPPVADYDALNVGQVSDALDGLSAYELQKVRRYEAAHKNRVTVLRDIDGRLD